MNGKERPKRRTKEGKRWGRFGMTNDEKRFLRWIMLSNDGVMESKDSYYTLVNKVE